MKKLFLLLALSLASISFGESNYKSLHLVAPEYREAVKDFIVDITTDEQIAQLQKTYLEEAKNPKVKPTQKITAPATKNQPKVDMYMFKPKNATSKKLPLIYHTHGGGYILGTALQNTDLLDKMANDNNAIVITVEYRLATEAPFPADVNDAYHGLSYVLKNSDRYGIDADKVILTGESAGGGLATRLGLMARDKKEHKISGQILVFPMLDYRTGTEEDIYKNEYAGEFTWTAASNRTGWSKLRGNKTISEKEMPYFSPALAKDVSNSPKTFIITGDLDLFVNENIDYANKLIKAGVSTELHVIPGMVHGYMLLLPDSEQSLQYEELKNRAIQKMFDGK